MFPIASAATPCGLLMAGVILFGMATAEATLADSWSFVRSRCARVRLCTIDGCVKLSRICDLNPFFRSDYDNRGSVLDADAHPEHTICLNLRRTMPDGSLRKGICGT